MDLRCPLVHFARVIHCWETSIKTQRSHITETTKKAQFPYFLMFSLLKINQSSSFVKKTLITNRIDEKSPAIPCRSTDVSKWQPFYHKGKINQVFYERSHFKGDCRKSVFKCCQLDYKWCAVTLSLKSVKKQCCNQILVSELVTTINCKKSCG